MIDPILFGSISLVLSPPISTFGDGGIRKGLELGRQVNEADRCWGRGFRRDTAPLNDALRFAALLEGF